MVSLERVQKGARYCSPECAQIIVNARRRNLRNQRRELATLRAVRRAEKAEARRLASSGRVAEAVAQLAHASTGAHIDEVRSLRDQIRQLKAEKAEFAELIQIAETLAAELLYVCAQTGYPLHTRPEIWDLAFEWLTEENSTRLGLPRNTPGNTGA
jgi:hypothetical protein